MNTPKAAIFQKTPTGGEAAAGASGDVECVWSSASLDCLPDGLFLALMMLAHRVCVQPNIGRAFGRFRASSNRLVSSAAGGTGREHLARADRVLAWNVRHCAGNWLAAA